MDTIITRLLFITLLACGLAACGSGSNEAVTLSREGESCTRTADCEGGLRCVAQTCVREAADGDSDSDPAAETPENGDTTEQTDLLENEGEAAENDGEAEGDLAEGDGEPEVNLCGIGDDIKTPATPPPPQLPVILGDETPRTPSLVTLSPAQQNAIVFVSSFYGNVGYICTGVLIAPRVILTSASCLRDPEPTDEFKEAEITVSFGHDINHHAALFTVTDFTTSPDYNSATYASDFAVLVLPHSAFAIPNFKLETIPFNEADLPASIIGKQVEAAGSDTGEIGPVRDWTVNTVKAQTATTIASSKGMGEGFPTDYRGGPVFYDLGAGTRIIAVYSNSDLSDNISGRVDVVSKWLNDMIDKNAGCGDLPATGSCDGTLLLKCVDGKLSTDECANREKICVPVGGDNQEAACAVDACGKLNFRGECTTDNVARWCDHNVVKQRHCTPCGQTCGFVSKGLGNYCVVPSEVEMPPCAKATNKCACTQCPESYAACLANDSCRLFVNCMLSGSEPDQCSATAEGTLLLQQYSACAVAAKCNTTGPLNHGAKCGSVSGQGCCQGSSVYYCDKGNLLSQDCGTTGCGWSADNAFYACQESKADPASTYPLACPSDLYTGPAK